MVEDIVAWAKWALELKCPLIRFEPVWYFFKLPRGTFGLGDYTKNPAWKDSGTPLPTFQTLRHILLDAEQPSTKDKTLVPASSPAPMAR